MSDLISSILHNIWAVFLIVLFFGGSIFVHELGHFLAARRRGVKVTRFSIGFGPAIWSHTAKDGVEYRLSWIPLGGYVALPQLADMPAIEGESEPVENLPPLSYGTRMMVLSAGAFFNILFAFVLATILWISGRPEAEHITSTRVGYVAEKVTLPNGKEVESPAKAAGLKEGDLITAIDGSPVKSWIDILNAIVLGTEVDDQGERLAVFTIIRDGHSADYRLKPVRAGDENIRTIGISPAFDLIIGKIAPGSTAETSGFRPEDRIVALDDQAVFGLGSFFTRLQAVTNEKCTVTVMRNGVPTQLTFPVNPKARTASFQGIELRSNWRLLYQNPLEQISQILANSVRTLKALLLPQGDVGLSNVSGFVGITQGFWDALKSEYPAHFVIWFAVMVNVSLAFFNLLPIPVLDGGHMFFATIAKLRGKALPFNFIAVTQSVFVVLLLTMMVYVTVFGDLRRIVRDRKADAQAREAAAAAEAQKTAEPAKP
jgi:regulator of sigma E protease